MAALEGGTQYPSWVVSRGVGFGSSSLVCSGVGDRRGLGGYFFGSQKAADVSRGLDGQRRQGGQSFCGPPLRVSGLAGRMLASSRHGEGVNIAWERRRGSNWVARTMSMRRFRWAVGRLQARGPRPITDDWDAEDDGIESWLDRFGEENEEVFLIKDPSDWIRGIQPEMAGGPRNLEEFSWMDDPWGRSVQKMGVEDVSKVRVPPYEGEHFLSWFLMSSSSPCRRPHHVARASLGESGRKCKACWTTAVGSRGRL